tara:strand:+ start:59 stop:187 length:129 start_codon:yes stop_codon:yes gene_type:complete
VVGVVQAQHLVYLELLVQIQFSQQKQQQVVVAVHLFQKMVLL